jgi:SP family sugar:H+ symporter-like MFS transporter
MLIDRIGRKPLLLVGSIGMTLTLGAMGAVFGTAGAGADGKPVLGHMAAVAGLTAANLYIVGFAVSWGPVMWVLLGEMFPNEIRGSCSCYFWRHQLGGEFHRHRHLFTAAEGGRSDGRLRFLRDSRSDLTPLRRAYRV